MSRQKRCMVNCVRAFRFHRCRCRRHRLVSGVCARVSKTNASDGRAGCAWRRDDKQPERTTVQASSPKRLWFFPPRRRCAYTTTTTTTTTGKSKVGKRSNSPLAGIALLPPRFYTVSLPSQPLVAVALHHHPPRSVSVSAHTKIIFFMLLNISRTLRTRNNKTLQADICTQSSAV